MIIYVNQQMIATQIAWHLFSGTFITQIDNIQISVALF